jgi:hypothetical protein
MDVYEINIETYESTCIFINDEGFEFGSVSPNHRYIAFGKVNNSNDSDIYLYDRMQSLLSPITIHEGECNYIPQ